IKGLVSAGMGITLLPESTVSETTPRFTTKIPIHTPEVKRTVGMIIPRNRNLAPSDQIFYEFVKSFFAMLEQYK
ncbi:LysR substrate-binding domain-containing protein, partial [Escherichia coli]|nr:LysR substrate-binding domain-containing protein [Escherichia coli]